MEILASTSEKPLEPHKYSLVMSGFGILIIASMFYSLYLVPDYFKAAKLYNLAQDEYHQNKFDESIDNLESALELAPSSKNARLLLAKSYFSIGGETNNELALVALGDMSLDKYEFEELKKLMPPVYQELFISKERG